MDQDWKFKTDELRRQAQRQLQEKSAGLPEMPTTDREELIEELRVHQIELTLQNEQLRDTQQALEESRNKYLDLYDFAPVGYFTVDSNMQVIEANWMYFTLLGTDRSRLIGQSFARRVNFSYAHPVAAPRGKHGHHRRTARGAVRRTGPDDLVLRRSVRVGGCRTTSAWRSGRRCDWLPLATSGSLC